LEFTVSPSAAAGEESFGGEEAGTPARRRALVDVEQLLKIREQLNRSGRIREILDDEGKILPSPGAVELVAREHAGESEVERYCLAQCLTLLALADKYRDELN
jgi:hypothetical protein